MSPQDQTLAAKMQQLIQRWRDRSNEKRNGFHMHSERSVFAMRKCADELETLLSSVSPTQEPVTATRADWDHAYRRAVLLWHQIDVAETAEAQKDLIASAMLQFLREATSLSPAPEPPVSGTGVRATVGVMPRQPH